MLETTPESMPATDPTAEVSARTETVKALLSAGDVRYQALLDAEPILIIEFDNSGAIRYLSPHFETLAGRTREELMDLPHWLRAGRNVVSLEDDLQQAQAASPCGVFWQIEHINGQHYQVEGVLWRGILGAGNYVHPRDSPSSESRHDTPILTALLRDRLPSEDESLQRLEQERALLDDLAILVSGQHDLNAVMRALSAQLKLLIPFDLLFISQLQDDELHVIASDCTVGSHESINFASVGDVEMVRALVLKEESWLCNSYTSKVAQTEPQSTINAHLRSNIRTRAFINLPLQIEGQVIGLLHLDSYGPDVFRTEHLQLAQTVTSHLAGAVRQLQLLENSRAAGVRLTELVEQIDAVVWEIDPIRQCYTFVSPRIEQWLGYPVNNWMDSVENNVERFVHPEDRARLAQSAPHLIAPGKPLSQEFRLLAANGDQVWVREIVTVQFHEDHPLRLHGVMVDISERKRLEEERELLTQLTYAITMQSDLNSLVRELRARLQTLMPCDTLFISQWQDETATILAIDPLHHPKKYLWKLQDWKQNGLDLWDELGKGKAIFDNDWYPRHDQNEVEYKKMAEEAHQSRAYINVPLIAGGQLKGILHIDSVRPGVYTSEHIRLAQLIGQEITIAVNQAILIEQAQRSAAEMQESNAILRATMEAAADGICLINEAGAVVSCNNRFTDLWRISPAQLADLQSQQQVFAHLLSMLQEPDDFMESVNHLFENARDFTRNEALLRDGRTFEHFSAPAVAPDGNSYGRVWSFSDISVRKSAQQRLEHQAFHDPLTNLPNRALFMQNLTRALGRAQRSTHNVAVLFLDLDRFKIVNDSLGHETGDQLLIEAAERLRKCLRPGDLAARFGGDEFTVLLEGVEQPDTATRVAERIAVALSAPFDLGGHEVTTTASVGIVISVQGGDRAEDLLRDADVAMYRAKSKGRARYEIFDAAMSARAFERLKTEVDLRQGIKNDHLRLHFQPIVDLKSGRIIGAEALVRWQHPERGLIFPDSFISLSEESDLIFALGNWVLNKACEQTRIWTRHFNSEQAFAISVNLSARQFLQPDLIKQVAAVLDSSGLEAHRLNLEITESVMLEGGGTHQKSLQALKELGVQLAIDDFGTGYSSLSYLLSFPLDTLKIDKSFVQRALENERDSAIVRAVHDLSQAVGMKVVAEGIETAALLQQLRTLGCDAGQGYFFSKPLTAADFTQLLDSNPQW